MTRPIEVRAVFEQAIATKRAVEIRHRNQVEFVRFEPIGCGEKSAPGYMPEQSGTWPRSARFAEIEEALLV